MMPSAKHGDPQLGIDIHLCTTPAGPLPLPTPHLSMVFDPFDYIPVIGATVHVMGMKRATAGTGALTLHIPPGFPFAPMLPEHDDELFMGSATVVADGDPLSHLALPVLGCQIAGMPSPPRPKKRRIPKPTLLPTTFNLAIPGNVLVGGPPTISMMGMAARGAFAGLGKLAKSRLARSLGDSFRKFRQKLFKNMDPGFLKCKVLRAEPVNILTGEVVVEQSDFTLPGRLPLEWTRCYRSGSRRRGACGTGWESPADARLEIDAADGSVLFVYPGDGPALFPALPTSQGDAAAVLELVDGALLSDHGDEWRVRTKSDRIYHFAKALMTRSENLHEVPLGRISDLCGNWLAYERIEGRLAALHESGGRHLLVEPRDGCIRSLSLYLPDTGFSHTFVSYGYDAEGRLVAARDALGEPYAFAYDGSHRMVRHTSRTGLSFHYAYDGERVVHAWGDGGLYDYRFEYQPAIREVRITDSLGHASTVACNEQGLPVWELDPLDGRTVFEYDEAGRTTAVVDPANRRTGYAYDERGNLRRLTRPDGSAIAIEVDAGNKPTCITDPNGAAWQQAWDGRGLLVAQTSPLGAVTAYAYGPDGLLRTVTDALQATTRLDHDHDGYLVGVTDALGHVSRFERDELGQVLAHTDPLGRRTAYRHDAKGRLLEAVLPGSGCIRCEWDAQDNLTRHEDEQGAVTRFEYFGQGLLAKRHQPDGHVVEYHYDTEERLVGVSNQRCERYELRRDALGRVVQEVDYWDQATGYRLDAVGRLVQSCDPLGRTIDYTTDMLGRITRKSFVHPDDPARRFEEVFEFDAAGNLTGCTNEHAKVQRGFDAEGRLVEERQNAFVVKNTFDALGRRVRRETGGHAVAYGYDMLGRVATVQIDAEAPIAIERDAAGQVLKETLGAALERHYRYDAEGRLAAQGLRREAEWLFHTQYAYDAAGNLAQRQDSHTGVERYRYDPLGQVVEHVDPQGRLKRFFHDPAGDRLMTRTKADESAGWRREGWCEGVFYRFDAAGNLVERRDQGHLERLDDAPKTTTLMWDTNQRLVRSRTGEVETSYGYDPLGRRVFKRTGDACTWFGWDGDALAAEGPGEAPRPGPVPPPYKLVGIPKRQAESHPWPAWQAQREYVYYPDTFVPLALLDGVGSYHYHNDPNGCPTRLTRADGHLVWAARYEVWSQARVWVNEVDNPIRLQGQYADPETGLYYNRHRYFDPLAGVFVSQDPIGLEGGLNTYQYAANALAWIDPLGLARGKSRGASSDEVFIRHVSAAEAASVEATDPKGLVPKMHGNTPSRGAKWISKKGFERNAGDLGKSANYTHTLIIKAEPGTEQWLKDHAFDWERRLPGQTEKHLTDKILTKGNEVGSYGIGSGLLEDFNRRIRSITVSRCR